MNKIKEKRIQLGLTQHQLADLTNIPFRTIQNWETGQRKCPDYVERLVLEKMERLNEQTHGYWEYIREPNTVDTYGRPVFHAKCTICGFRWGDLYSVENYFKCCPRCGKPLQIKKEG